MSSGEQLCVSTCGMFCTVAMQAYTYTGGLSSGGLFDGDPTCGSLLASFRSCGVTTVWLRSMAAALWCSRRHVDDGYTVDLATY